MRIGFCVQYTQRESTWMALQLAEHCRQYGEVSVRTTGVVRPLGHAWDHRVIVDNKSRFTDWAKRHDALFWFHPGAESQVRWAATHGCYVYAMYVPDTWHVIQSAKPARLNAYHAVYCNSTDLPQLRRTAPKASLVPVRWSPQLPIVRRVFEYSDAPRIAVPLLHGTAQYVPAQLWRSLEYVLQYHRTLQVVILTDTSSQYVRWQVRKLQKQYGERVTQVVTTTRPEVLDVLQTVTLTWLPATVPSIGLTALWSIAVGTPVLAFDVLPYSSIISNEQNGWLVLRESAVTAATGSPLLPAYLRMSGQLLSVLSRTPRLRDIYRKVADDIQNRRTVFDCIWRSAFGD